MQTASSILIKSFATELELNAAAQIAKTLTEVINQKRSLSLLLSGGSSITMYQHILPHLPASASLSQVTLALVDERFGAFGHPDSNETQLQASGLIEAWTSRGAQWVGMLTSDSSIDLAETSVKASRAYDDLVLSADRVIALLGLGEDGHTAGWLPTRDSERFDQLYQRRDLSVIGYDVETADSRNPHRQRLTLSIPSLIMANPLFVYARGEGKRSALINLMQETGETWQTPARALRQATTVMVLTDLQL